MLYHTLSSGPKQGRQSVHIQCRLRNSFGKRPVTRQYTSLLNLALAVSAIKVAIAWCISYHGREELHPSLVPWTSCETHGEVGGMVATVSERLEPRKRISILRSRAHANVTLLVPDTALVISADCQSRGQFFSCKRPADSPRQRDSVVALILQPHAAPQSSLTPCQVCVNGLRSSGRSNDWP